jgi:DNA helicase II / ATP-dependent DNA helicase PcrA
MNDIEHDERLGEMNEYRVAGPPGTGKTTYLARQIEAAANKHGAENIIVASYTKAAATELNRRELPIPRENIGTLHALCYRYLKDYAIAEVNAESFNEEHPQDAISGGRSNMDEMLVDAVYETDGDGHLATYNLWRSKCLPLETMPKNTIAWVKKWESWKHGNQMIDFTDMISITLSMGNPFPGDPTVGIYDEVQDFDALQMRLLRHWSQFQNHIILAGDADQTLYSFAGASPEAFLNPPLLPQFKRVLRQSWRLPKKVHELSQRWIKKIKNREPQDFLPREEEGHTAMLRGAYNAPDEIVDLAGRLASDGKSVMILASSGYLLNQTKVKLKEAGLPYWNPYRPARGDWNPMGSFKRMAAGRISTRERILSFLNNVAGDYWRVEDLARWIELIKIRGVLKKGAKDRITWLLEDREGFLGGNEAEFYAEIFEEFALERAMRRDVAWLQSALLSTKRNAATYPLTVYKKHGRQALEDKPRITIGTVHSVKGGEAAAVILYPDLSRAAMMEYQKDPDSVIRTFYVGMTRARESLYICRNGSNMAVNLQV